MQKLTSKDDYIREITADLRQRAERKKVVAAMNFDSLFVDLEDGEEFRSVPLKDFTRDALATVYRSLRDKEIAAYVSVAAINKTETADMPVYSYGFLIQRDAALSFGISEKGELLDKSVAVSVESAELQGGKK